MPDTYYCALRHTDYIQGLTLGSDSPGAFYMYSINDWRDPYWHTGGSSCTGYKELSPFYQRWIVYGVKFTVMATSTTTDSVAIGIYPLSTVESNPPVASLRDLFLESSHRGAVYKRFRPKLYTSTTTYLSAWYTTKRVEQQSFLDPDLYSGSPTTSPSRLARAAICIFRLAPHVGGSVDLRISIIAKYYGKFYFRAPTDYDTPIGT